LWFFLFIYVIQHCFICRHLDSTVSETAGIEPRTVATLALTARCSNLSARSHPHQLDLILKLANVIIKTFTYKPCLRKYFLLFKTSANLLKEKCVAFKARPKLKMLKCRTIFHLRNSLFDSAE
jgi:hypothetical protein